MKYVSATIFLLILSGSRAWTQDCKSSYFTRSEAVIETTEYDEHNALKSRRVFIVSRVQQTSNGFTSTFRSIKTERDGKVHENVDMHYSCDRLGVKWGLGANDPDTGQEAILEFPNKMTTGMSLEPDVSYNTNIQGNDNKQAELFVAVKNRKVQGNETVSIVAGTWECTKLTYDLKVVLTFGPIKIPINTTVTDWYNPKVGVVRSEVYKRKADKPFRDYLPSEMIHLD